MSLKDYVAMAYQVKLYQVSGPDWIGSTRFDIAATLPPGGLERAEVSRMMQTLLDERFEMKMHREKREFPVYALEIGKGGLKIQESAPLPDGQDRNAPLDFTGGGSSQGVAVNLGRGAAFAFSNNRFEAKRLNMPTVAATLERFLERPVVDMTGLKGDYDFAFEVTPEDYRAMLVRSAVVAGISLPPEALRALDAGSPVSLFEQLQKLGLALTSRRAPLDVLVIDSALKNPTEN
jgi:uncharacterized protein (TIGR03435 family)